MAHSFRWILLSSMMLSTACSSLPFVWIDDWSDPLAASRPAESAIEIGDTVSIRVWNQEGMSTKARVRSDGKVALPLMGEIVASGKRPSELGKLIEKQLTTFMVTPQVTVNIEETRPTTVSVIGEVPRPGSFTVRPRAGVLEVLANAGGFTEFASGDRIFIVRGGEKPARIRCTYRQLQSSTGKAASFVLRDGDVIVVE